MGTAVRGGSINYRLGLDRARPKRGQHNIDPCRRIVAIGTIDRVSGCAKNPPGQSIATSHFADMMLKMHDVWAIAIVSQLDRLMGTTTHSGSHRSVPHLLTV